MRWDSYEDFLMYHKDNPKLYWMFEKFTFEIINRGRTHFGAKSIIERMRWESLVSAEDGKYKINNNSAPFYARLFEEKYPSLKGFFRKRRSVADQKSMFC